MMNIDDLFLNHDLKKDGILDLSNVRVPPSLWRLII